MLDRAALTFCLADAFHPGCEMTWPVRHSTMYSAPFRIRHRRADDPEPLARVRLLPRKLFVTMGGPLYAQGTGRALPVDGGALADRHGELPGWL